MKPVKLSIPDETESRKEVLKQTRQSVTIDQLKTVMW